MGWPERLEACGQLGFDFLELSIDETDQRLARLDWDGAQRAALRRAIQETGVPSAPCA